MLDSVNKYNACYCKNTQEYLKWTELEFSFSDMYILIWRKYDSTHDVMIIGSIHEKIKS